MGTTFNPFTGTLIPVKKGQQSLWPVHIEFNDVTDVGGGAVEASEFNRKNFLFSSGLGQSVRGSFIIPRDYLSGPLTLAMHCYSESVAGNYQLKAIATLIRDGVDAVSSQTNFFISTNPVIANDALAFKDKLISFDITDGNGMINGVAISANDMIDIKIYREIGIPTDDVNDIRLLPYGQIFRLG